MGDRDAEGTATPGSAASGSRPPGRTTASTRALTRLTAVSRALTYAVSIDEVLDITVDCAADLLDATRVVLMLVDDDGLLRIRAARGIDDAVMARFREPLDETLLSRLTGLMGPDPAEGFLGVPLVVRGRVTGLLAVHRPLDGPPTEHDEWLLSALADQAAVALANTTAEEGRSRLATEVETLRERGARQEDALRMVGHDLRSPLNALQGYIHLLETESYGPVTDGQRTALGRLAAIGRHLEALVTNVQEMGQLATGTLRLECEPIDLADVVESARILVALGAEEADIELSVPDCSGVRVVADRDRLRQVLIQLVDNALKYAPRGSTVRLAASEEKDPESGEPCVAIRVADQGPGVPEAEAESIFEPYRQLKRGASAGGIGLGLAIARGLVDRMGGTLVVENAGSEEGATFVIRLPRA